MNAIEIKAARNSIDRYLRGFDSISQEDFTAYLIKIGYTKADAEFMMWVMLGEGSLIRSGDLGFLKLVLYDGSTPYYWQNPKESYLTSSYYPATASFTTFGTIKPPYFGTAKQHDER